MYMYVMRKCVCVCLQMRWKDAPVFKVSNQLKIVDRDQLRQFFCLLERISKPADVGMFELFAIEKI